MFNTILPWIFMAVLMVSLVTVLVYGQPKHYLVGFLVAMEFIFGFTMQDISLGPNQWIIYPISDSIFITVLLAISTKIHNGRVIIHEKWAFFIAVYNMITFASHILRELGAPFLDVTYNYYATNNVLYVAGLLTLFASAVPKSFRDARELLRLKLIFLISGLIPRIVETFRRAFRP